MNLSQNISVLLVDDEPDVSSFIRMKIALDAPNISMDTVNSGQDCLEYLKNKSVDCILSDYQMPGMNGMELLLAIRDSGNNTPFIFITGQGNQEIAREAFLNGADDYFTKDIGFAYFTRIINSIERAIKHRASDAERLKAERELEEEKNKLEAMFASMPDGLSIIGPDFTILRQNRVQVERVGDHVGEKCYEAYHGKQSVCEGCMVEEAFEDGAVHNAERELVRDGEKLYYDITAAPVRDASGSVIACLEITVDITDRKRAENELKASQNFLGAIIETEPECVKILNPDGTLQLMNRAGLDMIEADSMDQVRGKQVIDLIAPEDREAFTGVGKKVFSGETAVLEFGMIGFNGRRLTLETHAVPLRNEKDEIVALLGVTRDVTERKRTEELLENEHAQLLTILDSISEIVYVSDPDTYEVLYANRALKERFGIDPVGGICFTEFQKRDKPCDFCTNDIILKNKGEVYRWEYHNPVLDKDLLVEDSIIRWPDGRDVRFELAVDITEQMRKVKAG